MSHAPIQITLPKETERALLNVVAWPRKMTRKLIEELNLLNQETKGHIEQARATGKGPFPVAEGRLGVVTSRYRRQVRASFPVISGRDIESAIGNNVRYAGAHEYGFRGTVQVREHRKRNAMVDLVQVGDQVVPRWQSFGLKGKKTKVATGVVRVRAHRMAMNIPARAPIRRGIEDRLPRYAPRLGAAIVAALEEGGN